MSKIQKALIVFSVLSIPGLFLSMLTLWVSVTDMYDRWGEGLHYKSVLALAMAAQPVPLIAVLIGVIVFVSKRNLDGLLRFVFIAAWVQAGFCLAIPVLLAVLENELNFPTIVLPSMCACIAGAFACFCALIRERIATSPSAPDAPPVAASASKVPVQTQSASAL